MESEIGSLEGAGAPLDREDRAFFEPRFGQEFGRVRVHADARAERLTQALGAKALTFGRNIAFDVGEYRPGTTRGRRLLAHELTHIVQQGGGLRSSSNDIDGLVVQGFWRELAEAAETLADISSARYIWDPVNEQLNSWEEELDQIGEQSGNFGIGTNALMGAVALLYVILRSITGLLDLLARLNTASVALNASATSIRLTLSENPEEEISQIADEVGETALDILTLGLLQAISHMREGIREANTFRISQAVGEIAIAVLALLGIIRGVRSLRAGSLSTRGLRYSVPARLAALQRTLRAAFNRLGGRGTGYRIFVCEDATVVESGSNLTNVGATAKHLGGAFSDPTTSTIWIHEDLVRAGGITRSWGSRLNLNQVIAHEIGHAQGATISCSQASRLGADLTSLTQAERLGLLDDAVRIAPSEGLGPADLNLPSDYVPH